jgi:hypothetical protein
MKTFVLACASTVLFACGSSFTSGEVGGAAGSVRPDASAGAAGAGGDTSSGAAGSSSSVGGSNGTGGSTGAGGSASGGAAGSSGAGGAAGSAGSPIDAGRDTGMPDGGATACKIDSDCKLVDDCCLGCIAKGTDFPVPPCAKQCLIDPCKAAGDVKGVRCFEGFCALANECDPSVVACLAMPPMCPPGEVPSISGACWSGHCVKASSCRTVKDCSACDPQQHICVRTEAQIAVTIRCIDVPPTCAMNRTCACAGTYACMSPYRTCAESSGGALNCSCPTC